MSHRATVESKQTIKLAKSTHHKLLRQCWGVQGELGVSSQMAVTHLYFVFSFTALRILIQKSIAGLGKLP